MKQNLFIFYMMFVCVNAYGQAFFSKYRTIDDLYLNDSTCSYISKSPLSCFNRFDSIYSDFGYCINEVDVRPGFQDKNYIAHWIIINRKLFLLDIQNDCFLHKKMPLKTMERFVGAKFIKSKSIIGNSSRILEHGVLPAYWFSDTLYIKKWSNEMFEPANYYDTYDLCLIFDKGQLIKEINVKKK